MFINLFPLHHINIKGWTLDIKVVHISGQVIIPVPRSKTKGVLELEEGEAVLAVPVIGLILHPVKPRAM